MLDYIIVGTGLAGMSFAEVCLQESKTFVVFDIPERASSKVAGGLYNPVILKRFSEVWKAKEQLLLMDTFYASIARRIDYSFDQKIPVYRKFTSVEEQNNWFQAADKPNLAPFLSSKLIHKPFPGITADFGYGVVLRTGVMDVASLLKHFHAYLRQMNAFFEETFVYEEISFYDDFVEYHGIKAKNIVFAEGFGLHSNIYFKDLPLDGTKGELLIIKAPNLGLDVILNASIFMVPLGNDLFKVGATYNWDDKTSLPTEEGKRELLLNLKEVIDCEFEVMEHLAGVRPTVKDRRPLVGTHYKYNRLHLLNGLGTRGVMLGPWLAKELFKHIETSKPLDPNIDIKRCYKKMGIT